MPGYAPLTPCNVWQARMVCARAKKFPIHPAHPERLCWGCDKYCPADAMACGNGTSRTQHPVEFFGDDWFDWQAPTAGVEQPPPLPEPPVAA